MINKIDFSHPLTLDGSMSTSLERLGCNTDNELWTAAALIDQPSLVKQVHDEYFAAGARVAITDTYQANVPALEKQADLNENQARAIIRRAVELAKRSRDNFERQTGIHNYVAGSLGPYGAYLADGSEYRGDYQLTVAEFQQFHRPRIEEITTVGVDCLALETQPQLAEVVAVLDLLKQAFTDQSVYVSFTLRDADTISDGTSLKEAARVVEQYDQVVAVGINCMPPRLAVPALNNLRQATSLPLVVYPNSGAQYDSRTKTWNDSTQMGDFGDLARHCLAAGAMLIGGCCTTTPQDIARVAKVLQQNKS